MQKADRPLAGKWLLAKVPLFTALSEDEVERLAGFARRKRFPKGEVIFHEGDVGTSLFIVESGEVKIVIRSADGKEATVGFRSPGDFFGELALLDGEPRSADVIATQASTLLVLSRDEFLKFLGEQPAVAASLLAVLSRRLRATTRLVHDTAFLDVRARVVKTLLELAQARGIPESGDEISIPRLTQTDLASMVGATRESVNKWLRYYERLGILSLRRGQIRIRDPQKLRQEIY